jgi:hypothetical protein
VRECRKIQDQSILTEVEDKIGFIFKEFVYISPLSSRPMRVLAAISARPYVPLKGSEKDVRADAMLMLSSPQDSNILSIACVMPPHSAIG